MIDRFAHPEAFAVLILVAAGAATLTRSRRPVLTLPTLRDSAEPSWRTRLAWLPGALRLASLSLACVALARPQDVIGHVRTSSEGLAIMLVIDRSASMGEALDTPQGPATRISVVKRVVRDFMLGDGSRLAGRRGDLVGLVAFARYADTICPLVQSPEPLVALCEQTRLADPRSMEGGTAIGDGIALAAARLKSIEDQRKEQDGPPIKSKVMVVLTDGQDNASRVQPLDATALAAQWGIRIHTIAVGSGERMVRVQTPFGERAVPMGDGADEELLREIAARTGGSAFTATDAEALRDVYERIDELEKTKIETTTRTDHEERFQGFALAAALLLVVEGVVGATWLRRSP